MHACILLQLANVKVYCKPGTSAEEDRRFELFHVADAGLIEPYVLQCKNDYSKDAWLRDIEEAMLAAG